MKYIILLLLLVTEIMVSKPCSAQLAYTFGRSFTGPGNSTGDVIAVRPGKGGSMYVLGTFIRNIEMGSGSSLSIHAVNPSVYIAKYDAGGNYVFAISLQGRGFPGIAATAMTLDSQDNIYIAGYFDSSVDFNPDPADSAILYCAGVSNMFFAKYDSSGNYRYAKALEGTSQNFTWDMKCDSKGNLLLAGQFFAAVDFDPSAAFAKAGAKGGQNSFLAKYDTAGNYIFAKVLTGTGDNQANQMAIDSKDNICITGSFYKTMDADPGSGVKTLTSADLADVYFARYDNLGNYRGAQSLEGMNSQQGLAIALDKDDQLYLAGSFFGRIDTDPSTAVVEYVSAGNTDIFFARYDTGGHYLMSQALEGKGMNQPNAIVIDDYKNIYIAGRSLDSVDFDPSPLTTAIQSSNCLFIAAYDSMGRYHFVQTTSGRSNQQYCAGLQRDRNNDFYWGGTFDTTIQVDFSGSAAELNNAGTRAGFIVRYHQCLLPEAAFTYDKGTFTYSGSWPVDSVKWDFGDGSRNTGTNPKHIYSSAGNYTACAVAFACGISDTFCVDIDIPVSVPETSNAFQATAFPNPVQRMLYLQGLQKGTHYTLTDITGKPVSSGQTDNSDMTLDFNGYAPGLYLLRCTGINGQRSLFKIVRE